jgi:hypothetical protein
MNNKINVSKYRENIPQNIGNKNIDDVNVNNSNNNDNKIGQNLKNSDLQKSLMDMNKSLRTDIKLSIAIFKQKNNFECNYINHNIENALGIQ